MTRDDDSDSVEGAHRADDSDCVRRSVLRGAVVLGAVGVGAALSRLGAGSADTASATVAQGSTPPTGTGVTAAPADGGTNAGAGAKKGRPLGAASQIPVGGGKIFEKAKVVVTQPTAGEYKAFSAICSHETCLLADVADGTINCACHGSTFSITDGSPVKLFPATESLPAKTVTVSGGKLFVI